MLTIPKNRGKMIGVVYTGFSGANVFGVPIGTMIGDWIGWRFTFVFIIVISLIAGLLMKYLPTTTELNQANRMYTFPMIIKSHLILFDQLRSLSFSNYIAYSNR